MSASPIAGNESFTNVVYQAGVVNSEPNLPSTINMENAPIVDAFGRCAYSRCIWT
jgi:hypothetical protein